MATVSRGILAGGGFRRQHDRIGAVEDGVGHVAGLGARGTRIFDHGLEHLGGDDHRLAPVCSAPDDVFLNHRHFLRRHFHAQVAARHHHSIGGLENFFQLLQRLRLFQLGDHRHVRPWLGDDLLHRPHVCAERTNDRATMSTPFFKPKFKIGAVFGGKRGNGERHSRQVDALMLPQHAAVDHFALHVAAAHPNRPATRSVRRRAECAHPGRTSCASPGNVVEISWRCRRHRGV